MSQCLNPNCLKISPDSSQFCQFCGVGLLLAQRYRALRILGQGGFGRTFRAVDEYKPSRPLCVIKQFLPQAQGTNNVQKAAELFEQEAVYLENLGKHDQIPELLAHFTQDTHQYLIQQYILGQNLAQALVEDGVFNESAIWQVLTDILCVLQFVHQNNVIHRDIKPENIIRRENDNKLVLVDFGASKVTENLGLSVTGTVIGSAEYTAPEQAKGKPKFASDLYSLGVTCLHLLTNISPFDLYSVEEGDWVWRDFLVDNPVSDKLGKILDKLIEGAVKRRYQSVEEVLADIVPKLTPIPNPTVIQAANPPQPVQPPSLPNSIQLKRFSFDIVTIDKITSGLFGQKTVKTKSRRGEAEYFTVDLGQNVGLDMVSIPGGKFLMGSPDDEEGRNNNESPQHWVTVSPFYLGKYAVTQAQWQAVMGSNPSKFQGANRPVERVSWYNCVEFCEKLSQKTGLIFRLPSEAEWEYACRASRGERPFAPTPFHFGETITPELANYDGNYVYGNGMKGEYRQKTIDVGSFPPNAFGLYDIHGNVLEWCADTWHNNYAGAPTDGSAWLNNDNHSQLRLLRGGSWGYGPRYCRSAFRDDDDPVYVSSDLGFRVVCSLPRTF